MARILRLWSEDDLTEQQLRARWERFGRDVEVIPHDPKTVDLVIELIARYLPDAIEVVYNASALAQCFNRQTGVQLIPLPVIFTNAAPGVPPEAYVEIEQAREVQRGGRHERWMSEADADEISWEFTFARRPTQQ